MLILEGVGDTLEDFYAVVGASAQRLQELLDQHEDHAPTAEDRQAYNFLRERDRHTDLCDAVSERYANKA